MMTKSELIKRLAARSGHHANDARRFLEELAILAVSHVQDTGEFVLPDIAKFQSVKKPARKGVALGVEWSKPACIVVKAKPIGAMKNSF